MRLSEAIRLGAMMKPQSHTELFEKRRVMRLSRSFPFVHIEYEDRTCALGAAYDAAKVGFKSIVVPAGTQASTFRGADVVYKADTTVAQWQTPSEWETWMEYACPVCREIRPLYRLVPHMNDDHRLTREVIADFVERDHEALPELREADVPEKVGV